MNLFTEDFTTGNYKRLLELAKSRYQFLTYTEALNQPSENSVIWRHDIDFSVDQAVSLADIELEIGVVSTYFVQLSSRFYNLFDQETKEKIRSISKMGHEIGLHFDPTVYNISTEVELTEKLGFEKAILENLIEANINSFSFHMPTDTIMCNQKREYAGMVNVYSPYFKENFKYCSDSNGYWRFENLESVLYDTHKRLHILTHPVWWVENSMTPLERLQGTINKTALGNKQWYLDVIKQSHRQA